MASSHLHRYKALVQCFPVSHGQLWIVPRDDHEPPRKCCQWARDDRAVLGAMENSIIVISSGRHFIGLSMSNGGQPHYLSTSPLRRRALGPTIRRKPCLHRCHLVATGVDAVIDAYIPGTDSPLVVVQIAH